MSNLSSHALLYENYAYKNTKNTKTIPKKKKTKKYQTKTLYKYQKKHIIRAIVDFKINKLTPVKAPHTIPPRPPMVTYVCQPTDFKCVSHPHTCIKSNMVCDGIYDCTDHSDEFNCTRDPAGKGAGNGLTAGKGAGTGAAAGTSSSSSSSSGNFKRWKKNPGSWGKQQRGRALANQHRDRMMKRHVVTHKLTRSFGLF